MPLSGEVVFMRIFDLGGTFSLPKARAALGVMAEAGSVQPSRAAPEYVHFTAPLVLNFASLNLDLRDVAGAPVGLSARLYEVGVLAVSLRAPIQAESLRDLSTRAEAAVSLNGRPASRNEIFQRVFESVKPLVQTAIEDVFEVAVEPEVYAAFCLKEAPGGAEGLLREQRARIAGLLVREPDPEKLSADEVDDILRNTSRYYREDLVIADWDAAIIVEPCGQYEDLLYVFEVANLQLFSLRKYDAYIDGVLDRGYEEHDRLMKGSHLWTRRAREMVRELGEVRMDLAKVTDELANTAKFFGDWYLARVYMGLAKKLHIGDYHHSVEEKLKTLNELYQSVLSEIEARQSLVLEILIVGLIVFEIGMAFWRH